MVRLFKALTALSVLGYVSETSGGATAGSKPHILMILVDDFGFNNVGYHRNKEVGEDPDNTDREVYTPNLDNLARSGVELNRHYTYNFCAPSRASLQSGRLPVHVSTIDTDPLSVNPDDPVSGFSGIPRNMTGIAEKMRSAGYRTHMTGKWDAGMATYEHTPLGRGYESFLGYYHHANDYWSETLSSGSSVVDDLCMMDNMDLVDLWENNGPAVTLNGTKYEEYMFTENSLKIIDSHDPSEPLFLFHSFHTVHTPLQIPSDRENRYSWLRNKHRRKYAAMVEYMDQSVGEMVFALQRKGMWENTLLVLSSDNGGPIYGSPVPPAGKNTKNLNAQYGAANNLPLRGGKISDFEGGIRVNAFVSGGAVPVAMRGTVMDDYVHIADWYATFCALAGVDAYDTKAEKANLPPVDSMNMWPLLSGEVAFGEGPRDEIHISRKTLIQGRFKLLTGSDNAIMGLFDEEYMCYDTHAVGYGPVAVLNAVSRGRYCGDGCLFDIHADPNEDNEVTEVYPEVVTRMMARLEELNKDNFNPDRGEPSKLGCTVAQEKYGGFYGPFIDIDQRTKKMTSTQFKELRFEQHRIQAVQSMGMNKWARLFRS